MKIAVGLGDQTPLDKEIELTKAAAKSGLYGVSIAEHIGLSSNDVFASMCVLSQHSHGMTLIANSVNQYTRHPISMAIATNTATIANEGKLILGLGTGAGDSLKKMRIDDSNSLSRLRETIEILRMLLRGKETSFDGKYVSLEPTKLQMNCETPIFVPALRDKAISFAGKHGDGIFLSNCSSTRFVEYSCKLLTERIKSGNFTVGVSLTYVSTTDRKKGLWTAKMILLRYLSLPGIGETLLGRSGLDPSIAGKIRSGQLQISDEITDMLCVVGGASALEKRLEEFKRAGASLVMVSSPSDQLISIRQLGDLGSSFE